MKRGRKSMSSVMTVEDLESPKPDAPYDLTDEQAEEWRAVVDRMPVGHFKRETWPLLSQYCRHISRGRHLARLINAIEQAKEFDAKEYRELLAAEKANTNAILTLATKMRLSQQSTYDEQKKRSQRSMRPWEG
jgi:hypothetical protein